MLELDYHTAFDMAPIGMVMSRHRLIVDCNRQLLTIFEARREQLIGCSFEVLYPSTAEFQRTGDRILAALDEQGRYADDRVMKRANGELFWCHVAGRALDAEDPHAAGIWSFEDLSAQRPVKADLTGREREVAARLLEGLTSKEIGKILNISHRTVEIYRARLMRKYGASTAADLVHKLITG